MAAQDYRDGSLTLGDVRALLGHATRMETGAFLQDRGALLDYSEDDLERDLGAARAHGLEVTSTIGVLRAAAKKGHLNAAQTVRALKTPPFAPRQACIGGSSNKEQD